MIEIKKDFFLEPKNRPTKNKDDLVSLTNRLEGQFLRNEGDKRLGSESASREAREARQRCDELSRIGNERDI